MRGSSGNVEFGDVHTHSLVGSGPAELIQGLLCDPLDRDPQLVRLLYHPPPLSPKLCVLFDIESVKRAFVSLQGQRDGVNPEQCLPSHLYLHSVFLEEPTQTSTRERT